MQAPESGSQQPPSPSDIDPTTQPERTADTGSLHNGLTQHPAFPPIDVANQAALLRESAGTGNSTAPSDAARPTASDAPDANADDAEYAPLLTRGDIWFMAVMATIILALTAYQIYLRYGWGIREIEVLHPAGDYHFTLEINSATWVEWMQLEGIGEVLARRIVEHRETHGPFRSIDDVNEVYGIGDATLEKMRPHLRLDTPVEAP